MFLKPMEEGEEKAIHLEVGRDVLVKLVSLGTPDSDGIRQVCHQPKFPTPPTEQRRPWRLHSMRAPMAQPSPNPHPSVRYLCCADR